MFVFTFSCALIVNDPLKGIVAKSSVLVTSEMPKSFGVHGKNLGASR